MALKAVAMAVGESIEEAPDGTASRMLAIHDIEHSAMERASIPDQIVGMNSVEAAEALELCCCCCCCVCPCLKDNLRFDEGQFAEAHVTGNRC